MHYEELPGRHGNDGGEIDDMFESWFKNNLFRKYLDAFCADMNSQEIKSLPAAREYHQFPIRLDPGNATEKRLIEDSDLFVSSCLPRFGDGSKDKPRFLDALSIKTKANGSSDKTSQTDHLLDDLIDRANSWRQLLVRFLK